MQCVNSLVHGVSFLSNADQAKLLYLIKWAQPCFDSATREVDERILVGAVVLYYYITKLSFVVLTNELLYLHLRNKP